MNCPRCASVLRGVNYEGTPIDTCDSCHGEWLDKAEILRINKAREVVFSEEDKLKVAGAQKGVVKVLAQEQKALTCPRCGNTRMKTYNYAYDSGVIVDQCPQCDGLWLDEGELEAIQIIMEAWEARDPELHKRFNPILESVSLQESSMVNDVLEGAIPKDAVGRRFIKAIAFNLI